jgi:hypothetical protein
MLQRISVFDEKIGALGRFNPRLNGPCPHFGPIEAVTTREYRTITKYWEFPPQRRMIKKAYRRQA